MRKRSWKSSFSHGPVELNVIPLIDVVFFLLVFYVISTSFTPEAAVSVERPSSTSTHTVDGEVVSVAVTRAGEIQVGRHGTDLAGLANVVGEALRTSKGTRVLVTADREVTTGMLLHVMDACSAGGATDINVAAIAVER